MNNTPTGEQILHSLIKLYAEQENIKVEYTIERGKHEKEKI